jgi:hypothetical protein
MALRDGPSDGGSIRPPGGDRPDEKRQQAQRTGGKAMKSMASMRFALTVLAVLAASAGLSVGLSWGQQKAAAPATRKVLRGDPGLQVTGNLHVRINLPDGSGGPEEKYFEKVTSIHFQDQWAILTLVESGEDTTLVVPRERIVYVKIWDVKDEPK